MIVRSDKFRHRQSERTFVDHISQTQLATLQAYSLFFDDPSETTTVRCGAHSCSFTQYINGNQVPQHCPSCQLRWRFCTTSLESESMLGATANFFSERWPQLCFYSITSDGRLLYK